MVDKSIPIIGDKSNPSHGIAAHPLYGFGNIKNLDITSNPGSIRLNFKTTASASTISGRITWFARDLTPAVAALYAMDETNKVYKSIDNGVTWTVIGDGTASGASGNGLGAGQGLAVWKNYLFSVGVSVGVYGPLDGAAAWTRAWVFTLSAVNNFAFNPCLASIDGNLYICNQNKVNKVAENAAPFAPGTGGSYTATPAAITLAAQYNISAIIDLGAYLMLGTKIAADSTNTYELGADIFPYDRSTLTLGLPIKIPEEGIQQMISVKNRLYFFAGTLGKFFLSDVSSYEKVFEIPNYVYSQDGTSLFFYPGAIMYLDDKIYFGLSGGGSPSTNNIAIWSYSLTKKTLQIENTISNGYDGSIQAVGISALFPIGRKQFAAGWQAADNTPQYGIDYSSTSRYTNYGGYLESALIKIGEVLGNRTIGSVEIALLKPLTSGQGVRIKWRKDLSSNWTTLATMDYITYGSIQGYNFSAASMTNLVYVQLRVELTSTDATSPELASINLKPD